MYTLNSNSVPNRTFTLVPADRQDFPKPQISTTTEMPPTQVSSYLRLKHPLYGKEYSKAFHQNAFIYKVSDPHGPIGVWLENIKA